MSVGGEPQCIAPRLSEELSGIVQVGCILARPVVVVPSAAPLLQEIEELRSSLGRRWARRSPAEIPELEPARRLYRELGIDPTKTRPSSEALLRRVLRDLPLPRISNAVDLGNLVSLRILLPIGLYDANKIETPVLLRRGRAGEAYAGIRKESVHLHGRLVLEDKRGPFGNPTSDSLRTSVDESTRSLWMVIFAPRSYPLRTLEEHVDTTCGVMERHLAPEDADLTTWGAVPGSNLAG